MNRMTLGLLVLTLNTAAISAAANTFNYFVEQPGMLKLVEKLNGQESARKWAEGVIEQNGLFYIVFGGYGSKLRAEEYLMK